MLVRQIGNRWWARGAATLAVAAAFVVGGCTAEAAPAVPGANDGSADPVLVEGRALWSANCVRCHGGAGGGGAGPALSEGRHPSADVMLATITSGRGAMPRFGGSLSDEQIEAIVRYIEDVL